jgi:hypothetical protein
LEKLKKVFLSHSSEDDTLTDNVYRWLMNQSYIGHIWTDKVQLRPGDDLKEIDKGIASSDFVIPIITSNSIKSEWVRYEIKKALKKGKNFYQ